MTRVYMLYYWAIHSFLFPLLLAFVHTHINDYQAYLFIYKAIIYIEKKSLKGMAFHSIFIFNLIESLTNERQQRRPKSHGSLQK